MTQMKLEGRMMRLLPVAIALIAAAIRLAPLLRSDLSFAMRPDDSFEYMQLAHGIRHGCGFARLAGGSCQPPEILRTPGYPIFLALFGDSIRWVLAAQAIMGGVVCLLVAEWIGGCWNLSAGLAAELLIAFDLPSIVMSNEVMAESLFQLALTAALILALRVGSRPRNAILTAAFAVAFAGAAVLIRPIAIILPFLLPVPLLASSRLERRLRLAAAALAFAIPTLALCVWSSRNYYVARYPGLSTVGAINMYYYRAADIVARRRGILLAAARASFARRLGVPYERIYSAAVQSPELARRMNRMGFEVVESYPWQAAAMTLQAAAYLALSPIRSPLARMLGTQGATAGDGLNAGAPSLGRVRMALQSMFGSPLLTALVALEAGLTLVLWIGIANGLARCRRVPNDYQMWVVYLAVSGVLLMVLAAGGEADVRFRAPVIPLLAAAAALGCFPSPAPLADAGEGLVPPASTGCDQSHRIVEESK